LSQALQITRMTQLTTTFTPTFSQAWLLLAVAILFEIAGTVCMRLSEGFTRLTPSVLIFAFYAVSFALNTFVIKVLGLSVVYAVWSGVGTAITAGIGILYFREPATAVKLASIGLVVIGVLEAPQRLAQAGRTLRRRSTQSHLDQVCNDRPCRQITLAR
jgi:small multidrug resistance pump